MRCDEAPESLLVVILLPSGNAVGFLLGGEKGIGANFSRKTGNFDGADSARRNGLSYHLGVTLSRSEDFSVLTPPGG